MSEATMNLMRAHLEAFVPLLVMEYKRRGGPTQDDFDSLGNVSQLIAEKGDQLMFRSKQTAHVMGELTRAIAIASFVPGGITFLGVKWETITNQ